MKLHKRHSFWAASAAISVLLTFFTGTSFACFQKGTESIKVAEDCCKGHCQHAMTGERATQCCQSHQGKASQVLPAASLKKITSLTIYILHISLLPPASLPGPEQCWVRVPKEERRPPRPSLFALHCVFLI